MTSTERVKKFRNAHPGYAAAYQRKWVSEHREHYLAYQKEYQKAYRAKKKAEKETKV